MNTRSAKGARGGEASAYELGGEQVEGYHAVHSLVRSGARRTRRVWVTEPSPGGRSATELVALAELAAAKGVPLERRHPDELRSRSLTGAAQGVIAWAEPVRSVPLGPLLETQRLTAHLFLLVLDGVTDPGNFGAILRTATCAGVTAVVIGRHRSAPLTPAAVKAAAGAVELVPISVVPGIPAALAQLSRAGIWVAGLHPGAADELWGASVLDGPIAIVLGAEGSGLSRLAKERCDVCLRVPQASALGSLNVGAAAAVACFEVARRRLAAPPADR